ncbi:MAG TPA: hypothetical protein VGB04_02390 [Allosphingosinicella sp.]
METIFGKIDEATVFVSDLTYVATRESGGRSPNPNVCIEHGYALKTLGWRRMISVMNTAFGHPEEHELPFDVRHARRPTLFDCPPDADEAVRRAAKDELAARLGIALRSILLDEAVRSAIRPPPPAQPHPHDLELLESVRRQLSLRLRRFLRQHNFGTPFRFAALDPLHEMNDDWVGAAYEFHDPALQARFAEIRRISHELGDLILERIYAMDRDPKMGWPKTDRDVAQGIQPKTLEAIAKMNSKASELADAIDSFERLARDHIPVASGVHSGSASAPTPDLRAEKASAALHELGFDARRGGVPALVSRPRLTLRIVPFAAMDEHRLEPQVVNKAMLRAPPSFTERVTSGSDARQWWACGPPRAIGEGMNRETHWLMRLVRPGTLEYQTTIGARVDDDADILVNGRQLEAMIVRNFERMAMIAGELSFEGPALVQISLEGMEDVSLTRARGGGRRIGQPDVSLPIATLKNLATPFAPALHEQLDILWNTSGWADGSPSFGGETWAGYADERNYGLD